MSLVNPIQWYLTFEAFDTNKKYMVDLRVTSSTLWLLSRGRMWKYFTIRNILYWLHTNLLVF